MNQGFGIEKILRSLKVEVQIDKKIYVTNIIIFNTEIPEEIRNGFTVQV